MTESKQRELVLDTARLEPWEIAAHLHIRLAYPLADEARMQRLIASVCADQMAVTLEKHPDRKAELLAKYPAYDPRKVRTGRENIVANLEDAHRMGTVVLVMIKEAATGKLPLIAGLPQRPSMAFLVKSIWPQHPGEPEESYEERVRMAQRRKLRDNFSVAHLAASLQYRAREMGAANLPMSFDYQDLEFLRCWVALAQEMAVHIRATPSLKGLSSKLIDLQWIEDEQLSAPPLGA